MSQAVRYLGIVPARAGSKGLPGKNMLDLGGRPLLQHTLEAATGSTRLDRILVTSDDEAALVLSEELGVPSVRRPAELATDDAPVLGAVLHAVDSIGAGVENVVLLQPTSPLRDARDVDAAVDAFESSGRATLVSVDPVSQHPCEVVRVVEGRLVRAVEWPEGATGRQALPEFFYVNGAIYIARVDRLRATGAFQDEDSAVYVMEPSHSVDVDDAFDLDVARGLLDGVRD